MEGYCSTGQRSQWAAVPMEEEEEEEEEEDDDDDEEEVSYFMIHTILFMIRTVQSPQLCNL